MPSRAVSIVVVNYNTRDLLVACLRSIHRHAPDAEIIVVDNASPDGSSVAVAELFPKVILVANQKNLGFARAMNLGLRAAQGALLFCLNADTELLADTLLPLQAALSNCPKAGIVGPAQYLPPTSPSNQTGSYLASAFFDPDLGTEALRLLCFTDTWAARLKRGPWQMPAGSPRSVDWIMGAALLIRRECLNAIRGFDESEFMYGEDWDMCYRARQAGWSVYYVPEARILHHENAAAKIAFGTRRAAHVLRATLHFHEKHYGRFSRRMLAGLNWLGAYLRLALLTPGWLKPASEFQARWQSLCHLAGVARAGLL